MALNRPPLLVLLGAGASMPSIPGVSALTEKLVAWPKFRSPAVGDCASGGGAFNVLTPLEGRGPTDKRCNFFQGLHDILASEYQRPQTVLNFEGLIHACDELAHVLPNEPDREDRLRWALGRFFRLRPEYAAWGEARAPLMMSLIAEEARYFILEHVADESERVTDLHPVSRGLQALADRFLLRMHSLNYDDLPLAMGLDVHTGFDKETGEFRPKYPWPAELDSFVQLHGSVRWGLVDSEIRSFDCIDKARADRDSRYNQRLLQDGHVLPLAPMITGLRKADLILERPYGTYLHVFREHLLSTPRWLIVGYGFGDQHVNRALQQAWAHWRSQEESARAVVINFLQSGNRNTVEVGSDDNRGWAKVMTLLAPVFRQELDPGWHLRNARKFPESGLVRTCSDNLGVQFDGGEVAMTGGLEEIVQFFDSR